MNLNNTQKIILAVDDTPGNIDVVKGVLSDIYFVQAAINGKMALKILEKQKPDLILLDIMMPEMDGYEVCQRIKEDESLSDIPIIFLTAKAEVDDETKGLELGAVDYITKPISPSILQARVQTHLRIKEANDILKHQNELLEENVRLRENVDRITRHDLKTPLNSILAYPKIMKNDDNLTEKQHKYLDAIESSGRTLLNMINLSLDLYRMEQGTYVVKKDQVDIIHVLKSILEDNRVIIKSKGFIIEILIDGKIADDKSINIIEGEELLFYSLLANLLKNAMEASSRKGQIRISLENGKNKKISISNTGTVPKEIQDTFFDKYITSGKSSGTGLGTYSARLITETMGGKIRLDSTIENETTIHMIFAGTI